MKSFDRIEKEITIHAPVSRVWRALTDIKEFEQWFGVKLNQPFQAGQTITGTFTSLPDEEELYNFQKAVGLEPAKVKMSTGSMVFCTVERMEPEHYFSFRWIPYAIDAECDPTNEPTTLVEFQLEPISNGTKLKITESGFNKVPAHRRERAFLMNEGGWSAQIENIKRHVEKA